MPVKFDRPKRYSHRFKLTYGDSVAQNNGYYHGKKWLNLTVTMWMQDLKDGLLFKEELYKDTFPKWWLDKLFKEATC